MNDLRSMLLGAALVAIGVLVSALADRIRGNAKTARHLPQARETAPRAKRDAGCLAPTSADAAMDADAISALCNMGYSRKAAAAAVAECSGAQRSTLESLIRACLRKVETGARSAA